MVKLELEDDEVELIQNALIARFIQTSKEYFDKRLKLARLQLKIEVEQDEQSKT